MNLYILRIKALIFIAVFTTANCNAQIPTYSIDPTFNAGELFKAYSPISDIHFLNDGRILVGGRFGNSDVTGFGMIYENGNWDNSFQTPEVQCGKIIAQEDGYVYPDITSYSKLSLDGPSWGSIYGDYWSDYKAGGTSSPYTVIRVWDIYQMENGDLLLGGAIANDTLLPNELRGISRIHSDGSHDPTFPVLNITPNNASGAVRKIYPAPDGSWYISGSFTAINDHETNHVAKLTPEFAVDTTFVSPFMYDGPVNYTEDIILVDDQSRVWVSGYRMRLQENPNDTIQIIRLLPNGEVDSTFLPRKSENNYPNSWYPSPSLAYYAREVESHPGNYFIYGSFSHFNDTLQSCITVVNDAGIIQENFFQSQGATEYDINNQAYPNMPRIRVVKQHADGSLLIGGGFTEFMGETRYSVVKLKQGFVGVEEAEQKVDIKLYPNPATDVLHISSGNANLKSGIIFNAVGQEVIAVLIKNQEGQVDIRRLNPGIYFVRIELESGYVVVKKFVKGSL